MHIDERIELFTLLSKQRTLESGLIQYDKQQIQS